MNDPEHAKMLVEARKRAKDTSESWAPPMATWSPEVDALHKVLDAVNGVRYIVAAANSEKGKGPKPPKPHPRPRTAIERMENQSRRESHEKLANRILARRKKPASTG